MRYWFFYILKDLGKLSKNIPQVLYSTLHIENITFRWGNYIDVLINELQDEFNGINKVVRVNNDKGNLCLLSML